MMKSVFTLLAATALLATSCSKDEVIEDVQLTVGYWSECYDNPNFSMDSSVKYKFELDGTYTLKVNHALVDTTVIYTHNYQLQNNVLTLQTDSPVAEQQSYNIILLNEEEMAWQRVGTSYSEGTLSSDYKHFKHYTYYYTDGNQ